MSNTVISPSMNMPVPVVGVDPGPDWATDINACLSIIDSHNHTSGQGVPITPQAININAELPMNGNNLTTARSVRFSPQNGTIVGATDLGCLYENGVDLYYVDGAGNQVRITQGGSVTGATGTITGLPSGTASASFAGTTFTFQSATNTPAAMNFGPVTLGQAVASGFNVTISASGSQPANYNLTLPIALPSTQSSLVSDNSGNTSFVQLEVGTYSPIFSSPTGGTGFSSSPMMWTRIGNIVSVAGRVDFVATGQVSTASMSLPVSRTDGNFTATNQAQGTVTGATSTTTMAGPVEAQITGNQLVTILYTASSGNTNGIMHLQFMYSLTNI